MKSIVLALMCLVLVGCCCENNTQRRGIFEDTWIGFYYPNSNNLTVHEQSGLLNSKEDCLRWVNNKKYEMNRSGFRMDDYECGKNCRQRSNYGGLYICETTER